MIMLHVYYLYVCLSFVLFYFAWFISFWNTCSFYVNAWFGWTIEQIQEYTEEFREIAGGKSKSRQKDGNLTDGNITLVNQRSINDDLPVRVYSFKIRIEFNLLGVVFMWLDYRLYWMEELGRGKP